jgi:hypothetical protein
MSPWQWDDQSRSQGSVNAAGGFRRRGTLPILETPFYFNELKEYVNEKIPAPQAL